MTAGTVGPGARRSAPEDETTERRAQAEAPETTRPRCVVAPSVGPRLLGPGFFCPGFHVRRGIREPLTRVVARGSPGLVVEPGVIRAAPRVCWLPTIATLRSIPTVRSISTV